MNILAQEATLTIGSQVFDCFTFHDGSIYFSQTYLTLLAGVTDDVSKAASRFINIAESRMAKTLDIPDLVITRKVKVRDRAERVNMVALASVPDFLTVCAGLGYKESCYLLSVFKGCNLEKAKITVGKNVAKSTFKRMRHDKQKVGCIYVIHLRGDEFKVGFSTNVEKRLKAIKCIAPDAKLITVFKNRTITHEKVLHRRLRVSIISNSISKTEVYNIDDINCFLQNIKDILYCK